MIRIIIITDTIVSFIIFIITVMLSIMPDMMLFFFSPKKIWIEFVRGMLWVIVQLATHVDRGRQVFMTWLASHGFMVELIVGKWQHTHTSRQPAGGKTLFCQSGISPARGGTDFFFTLDLFRGVLGFVRLKFWICSGAVLDLLDRGFWFVQLNLISSIEFLICSIEFWICRPACFERIQGRVGARPSMDCEEEEEATVASRNLFPTFAKSSLTGIVVGP